MGIKECTKEFLKTFFKSFNPGSVKKLSAEPAKSAVKYFMCLVLVSVIISFLISMPAIVKLPSYFNGKLSAFDRLVITQDNQMNKPLTIPDRNPIITIDTLSNSTELNDSKILITNNKIIIKKFLSQYEISTVGFSDILAHKDSFASFLSILLIAAIPILLFAAYMVIAVKYFLFAVIFATILWLAMRIIRYGITYSQTIKICIYSATAVVLIETINIFIRLNLFFIPLILSALIAIIAVILSGELKMEKIRDETVKKNDIFAKTKEEKIDVSKVMDSSSKKKVDVTEGGDYIILGENKE